MLEQIDHRGKQFTVSDDSTRDKAEIRRCQRAAALECQAQRERCELECAKAVAGPAGTNPDVKVLDR